MRTFTLLLLLSACGASEAEPVLPPAEAAAPIAAAEEIVAEAEPTPAAPDPGPPPPVAITVRDELDGVTLVVQVSGPASLAGRVRVERAAGATFAEGEPTVVPSGLGLRAGCGDPIPECRELIAGAELTPPAWTRKVGDEACGECRECTHAERGVYRFVLTSCDGQHRIESPVFQVR